MRGVSKTLLWVIVVALGGEARAEPLDLRRHLDTSARRLDLSTLSSVPGDPFDEAVLEQLQDRAFRNLTQVNLAGVDAAPRVLAHLGGFEIRKLGLADTPFGDRDLALLDGMPIVQLDLAGTRITDAGLARLPQGLGRLDLSRTAVTDAGMAALARASLSKLSLRDTAIGDSGLGHLAEAPIGELDLRDTGVSDAGIARLSGAHLHAIDLRGTGVTARVLQVLDPLPRLRSVALDRDEMSPWDLERYRRRNLRPFLQPGPDYAMAQTLDLRHLRGRGKDLLQLEHPDYARVEVLLLEGSDVTDADLAPLKHLKRLRRLDLTRTAIGDDGLRHVSGLPIEDLGLYGTQVGDRGLGSLQGMPLRRLELGATTISDAGLEVLQVLELSELGLGRTGITDEGLAHIRMLPLRELRVDHTRVTDEGLAQLLGKPRLTVHAHGADGVSEEGLALFGRRVEVSVLLDRDPIAPTEFLRGSIELHYPRGQGTLEANLNQPRLHLEWQPVSLGTAPVEVEILEDPPNPLQAGQRYRIPFEIRSILPGPTAGEGAGFDVLRAGTYTLRAHLRSDLSWATMPLDALLGAWSSRWTPVRITENTELPGTEDLVASFRSLDSEHRIALGRQLLSEQRLPAAVVLAEIEGAPPRESLELIELFRSAGGDPSALLPYFRRHAGAEGKRSLQSVPLTLARAGELLDLDFGIPWYESDTLQVEGSGQTILTSSATILTAPQRPGLHRLWSLRTRRTVAWIFVTGDAT